MAPKYLLDTHAFIYTAFSPELLGKKSSGIIADVENDIFISAMSFLEIALKFSLGKINLKGVAPEDLPQAARSMGLEILPVEADEACAFYKLPRTGHKDPFDRFLIWQAVCRKMVLISKDAETARYKHLGLLTIW
jgi:PIN domain nuclease of toxin-antitoxin system